MKNILLMVPRLNMGGAETYTYQLAKLLKAQGYNVVVASGGGLLAKELRQLSIPTPFLPIRFSTALSALILYFIIKKYKIDLIHANSAAAGITAVKCSEKYIKVPIIFTAHGVVTSQEATYLSKCSHIIAVSDFLKNQLIEQYIPAEKITRIYTGIDTEHFNPHKTKGISKLKLQIPSSAFLMVQVARIRNLNNKGHQILLNIMNNYHFAEDWHLIMVGDGSGFYHLQKELKRLNLEHRVHLVGQQNNVEEYTKIADVIVSPSRFETFGLALAEGMAMGKPGVAFNVGGVKEIIIDDSTGYLVEYPKEEDFALALDALAKDPITAKIMGEKARADIGHRFPIDKMMMEILDVYQRGIKLE